MNKNNYLIVIAGPTAVGKTALAIKLALHFKTEIISADARQFYSEMTLGTAKPSSEELALVKHHFIDNLSIRQPYTAGMYEKEVLAVLENLFQKHSIVILTGGSGLFIKTLTDGMDEIPDVEPEIRKKLNEEYRENGLVPLLEELKRVDPSYFEKVDQANPVRIIRALEVYRETGIPFSTFRTSVKKDRPFHTIKIALDRDREELYERINSRIEKMLGSGLVEEVKSLYAYKHLNALQTVGYTEVFGYLDRLYDYEEMIRLLKRNSRRYAKRQLTWFMKDKTFQWFHPDKEEEVVTFIGDKMLEIENRK